MLNLQSIYFGQKHADFDYKDFDVIKKISRLAKKHQRQCVNSCNGVGYVNGQCYYNGTIDDWARREYGQSVKSAYLDKDCEESVFDNEAGKIEDKINKLIDEMHNDPRRRKFLGQIIWKVEFQGDPRGATVKLYYEGDYIEL